MKIRTRGIIDKGVVAEERDARLELRDLDEELRRHLRLRIKTRSQRRILVGRARRARRLHAHEQHLVPRHLRLHTRLRKRDVRFKQHLEEQVLCRTIGTDTFKVGELLIRLAYRCGSITERRRVELQNTRADVEVSF